MSNIPRRSSIQQPSVIPRRSSSVDAFGVLSQQQFAFSQANRQSTGRSSSIGRASSIGLKPGEAKPINTHELATTIVTILHNLEYQQQPVNVKIMLLPSTGLFYNIFEFLLKNIGIHDVWNPNLLTQAQNNNQKGNMAFSSNQPQQNNAVAQNKARVELIIHHLTVLKYNNIPKANVIQTMTTPKNWTQMLQILAFLCHDCQFLQFYDATKILYQFDKTKEIFHEFLRRIYPFVIQDFNYTETEDCKKIKEDYLKRFESVLRGNSSLKQLESERDGLKKQFEFFDASKNELEELQQEESEMQRILSGEEKSFAKEKAEYEERIKRTKIEKNDTKALKEKLKQAEKEIAIKDIEYDKQLASGNQMDNLPIKHAQKVQELENAQNVFVELENKKDELHMKIMQKTQEVKDVIASVNELINKVKLGSSLPLELFPLIELLDFHKKQDIVKEYKDQIFRIRESYNSNICKLHEEFSQSKEEKKMIETKIEAHQSKMAELDSDNKRLEACTEVFKKEVEETLNILKKRFNDSLKKLNDVEKQHGTILQELQEIEQKMRSDKQSQKQIEENIRFELKTAEENYAESNKRNMNQLVDKENIKINSYNVQLEEYAMLKQKLAMLFSN